MNITNIDDKIISTINSASKYAAIKRVGIFGSYAKGEETKNSDIDIIFDYISTIDDTFLDDIENYYEELQTNLGNIDFIPYNGLENSNDVIKQSILNHIIWIYEK